MPFCLPTLHFLMGRTEGRNESFIAISRAQNKAIHSSPVLPKNVQEWQKILLAIQMNWQILGYPGTKFISRNDSFYSGMAVSLTYQSCKLACPQRLILPLYKAEFFYLI